MDPENIGASSLTSYNVIKALRGCRFEVHKHWEELARNLGVPSEIRHQQKVKANGWLVDWTYWCSLEECIHWWLRNSSHPTWEELARALDGLDRKSAKCQNRLLPAVHKEVMGPPEGKTETALLDFVKVHWQISLVVGVVILSIALYSVFATIVSWTCALVIVLFPMLCLFQAIHYWVSTVDKTEADLSQQPAPTTLADMTMPVMPPLHQRIWEAADTGCEIVEKCIETLMGAIDDSDFDYEFLRRLAFVMSRNGDSLNVLYIDGGIWQVSRYAFDKTKEIEETSTLLKQCEEFLGIEKWKWISKIELEKPIYSAVAARLYLSTIDEDVPTINNNIVAQQDYWWKYYMLNHEAKRFTDDREYLNSMRIYFSMKKGCNNR